MKLKPLAEWTEAEKQVMLQEVFSVLQGMADNETNDTDADPFADYDEILETAKENDLLIPEEGDKSFDSKWIDIP